MYSLHDGASQALEGSDDLHSSPSLLSEILSEYKEKFGENNPIYQSSSSDHVFDALENQGEIRLGDQFAHEFILDYPGTESMDFLTLPEARSYKNLGNNPCQYKSLKESLESK